MMTFEEKYKNKVVPAMRTKFGYKNIMAIPRVWKVVVNCGVGKIREEKERDELQKFLALITGQKPAPRAAKKARPVLLEPIMKVEVVVPEKFMGDITGNLSGKRGQMEAMEDRGELKVVRAKVPLSEMFGYVTSLRSMTEGRGSANMEFDHYAVVPTNVAETIIESRTGISTRAT